MPELTFHCPRHPAIHSTLHDSPLTRPLHSLQHFTVHDVSLIMTSIPLSTKFHCPRHSLPFLGIICGSGIICSVVQDTHRYRTSIGTGHPLPPHHRIKLEIVHIVKSLIESILLRMPRPVKLGNIQNSSQFINLIHSNIT